MSDAQSARRIVVVTPEELLLVPANPLRRLLVIHSTSPGHTLIYFERGGWNGPHVIGLAEWMGLELPYSWVGDVFVRRVAGDGQVFVDEFV